MRPFICLLTVWVVLHAQTPNTIAVINFDGKNVSAEEASALTDRLRIELFRTSRFKVFEREKMNAILDEQGFQLADCTSDACIVQMGQLIGVQQIVAGSVSHVGTVYSIAARVIDVERGEMLNIATFDYEGPIGDLLKFGMREVALQLAGLAAPVAPPLAVDSDKTVVPAIVPPPTDTRPVAPVAAAQPRRNSLGVMAGSGSATIFGGDVTPDIKTRPGSLFGLFLQFRIANPLYLRPELLVTRKGWIRVSDGDRFEETVELSYLQLPFIVQLNLPLTTKLAFTFSGGTAAGFLMSAGSRVTFDGEKISDDDVKARIRKGESTLILGFGLQYKNRFQFGFRSDIGLTSNDGSVNNIEQAADRKNSWTGLTFGYLFN